MGSEPFVAAQAVVLTGRTPQWLIGGLDYAVRCEQYHTNSNKSRNGGYCLPSRSYRGVIFEVSKDYQPMLALGKNRIDTVTYVDCRLRMC